LDKEIKEMDYLSAKSQTLQSGAKFKILIESHIQQLKQSKKPIFGSKIVSVNGSKDFQGVLK